MRHPCTECAEPVTLAEDDRPRWLVGRCAGCGARLYVLVEDGEPVKAEGEAQLPLEFAS